MGIDQIPMFCQFHIALVRGFIEGRHQSTWMKRDGTRCVGPLQLSSSTVPRGKIKVVPAFAPS